MNPFSQSSHSVRFEWGPKGARDAAERGDIVIIVDVLSFSSAVVVALQHGAIVYPHAPNSSAEKFAAEHGGEVTLKRDEAYRKGSPSLSPVSWNENHREKIYIVTSPNGALCAQYASKAKVLLVGGLINAAAAARVAIRLQKKLNIAITVIAAGERWQDIQQYENVLRPGVEDYLGAGAIIARLEGDLSPEASVCRNAFESSKEKLEQLVWYSGSGRELRAQGYEDDVKFSSQLDIYELVPQMKDQQLQPVYD